MRKIFIGLFLIFLIGVFVYASAPTLEILSPLNITYNTLNIDLNWSVNDTIIDAWYSLNGGGNVSLFNFTNIGHIDDGGYGRNVWGDGTYIYLANDGDGIRAYTFNGADLINVGHIDNGGNGWGVWGDGTYIYLANQADGIRAYTFDGVNFNNVGHIDDGGYGRDVWGDGTYIYLANEADGIRAYTFDGANFNNVGHIDDGGVFDIGTNVWGDGTYIYLANQADGIRAYTFDGANFNNVGHIDDGGNGLGVWGDGTYIYLANKADGIRVYTFNGTNFTNVGHIDDGGNGLGVWGDNTYIYLANYDDGIRAYTFNGTNFDNVGHIDDGEYGRNIWGDNTYIYLANSNDGLRAYTKFSNTTITATEGSNNVTVYINDTVGNTNETTQYFTVTSRPTYSTNSTNDTHVNSSNLHSLKWEDNTNLSGYIFSTNNTGTWSNDTWVPMTGTLNWSNVTKTVNNTLGTTIQWKVYANDTYDNWNESTIYSYTTTNTLPTIGAPTINDSTPHTNDSLLCNNGSFSDADGDTATWFYRWYDTNVLISGENTNILDLNGAGLDSGDTIICSTIASDGYDNATVWVNSTSSTIQYTPITNTPTITPTTAYTNNNLLCNATIIDLDIGNTLTAHYKWYLNGSLNETGSIIVTNNTNTLISTVLSGNTTKNDLWICEITPNDGVVNGTSINSTTKNISNSLPTQTPVTITPLPAETNDNLTCNHVYADDNNDTESGVLYRWFINGILNVTTQNLSYTSTSLGDNIKCGVDVYDGYENSSWANSSELTLGDTVAPVLHTQYLSATIGDINTVMTIGINVTEINDLYYVKVEITNPNDDKQNITMILDTNGGTEHYYTRQYTPQITGFYTFKFYSEDGSGNVATPLIGSYNYEAREVTEGTSGGGGGESQIIILTGNWTIMQQNIYLVVASANVTSYITIDNKANTEIENIEIGCIPSTCVEDDPSSCVNVCNYVTFGEELIAIEDKPLLQAYQIQPGQSGKLPFTTDFSLDFALKNNLPVIAAGTYKYSITIKIDDVTRPVSVTVVNLPSISVLGDILNWIPNETVIIPGETPFIIPNWLMLIILIILIIIVLAIIYRVLKKPKKKQFKQWW